MLSARALEIAASYVGLKETGHNSGPEIDLFLASVGQPPGQPWCHAFAYYCVMKAAAGLGVQNPLPAAYGSTQLAWRTAQPYMRDSNPKVGYLYVLRHSDRTGHAGFIESIDDFGVITEISGNTIDGKGGRLGNSVARLVGQPEVRHGGELLGFLDLDRGAQPV